MQLQLLCNFELIHYFPLQSILHLQLLYDWSDFDSLCTLLGDNDIDNDKWLLNDKLHTKRQQVHISMFHNSLQLTNSVAIGF
jgi:hypothetical protein